MLEPTVKNNILESIDEALACVYKDNNYSQELIDSINYSLLSNGKKIRPLLLLFTLLELDVDYMKGIDVAVALEMIHTYSLIHDDLPSIDNDDFRRGKLTNHRVYGEATAILAGDSLLTDSFRVISSSDLDDDVKVRLISLISTNIGSNGMIGGQMLDILSSNKNIDINTLDLIHYGKTVKLIEASILSAAIISRCDNSITKALTQIAYNLGMMFQIKDDILDYTTDSNELGKSTSDLENDKSTYIKLLGLEESQSILETLYTETIKLIETIKFNKGYLLDITNLFYNRKK